MEAKYSEASVEIVFLSSHKHATNARRLKNAGIVAPLDAIISATPATKHYLIYDYSIDWYVFKITEL